jgi:UDP-glucose 4-epimerase
LHAGPVAVTGAAGFIGSRLASHLAAAGQSVVAIDNLSRGRWETLRALSPASSPLAEKTLDLASAPLDELTALLRGVGTLVHLAAEKHHNALDAPERVLAVNVAGTHRLFEAAGRAGVARVIFSSSLYACGRMRGPDLTEYEAPAPATVYGASKLAGEALLRAAAQRHGYATASLRFFFVYGPGQAQGTGYPSVIVRSMARILQGQPPVVHGDGEQMLDYVHVQDVVRAVVAAMNGRAPNDALINIGSGQGRRIRDLVLDVIAATGRPVSPIPGPADWTAGTRRVAATKRALEQLGWRAEIPFEQGLREMWSEMQERGPA